MSEVSLLENPVSKSIGLASIRSPQTKGPTSIPSDWNIVSADNHYEVTEDIFYDSFPASMKEKAPRVWFDRHWRIGFPGQLEAFGTSPRVAEILERIMVPNGFDTRVRNAHLDAEGVRSEILFPQSLFGFLRHKDLEIRELMYRIYNENLAKLSIENPGRSYGVAVFSNWWDPAKAESSMQQIVDLGLKTFVIPFGIKDSDGREVSLASEKLDRFWSVAESAGLPVNFHIGEDPSSLEGRGAWAANFLYVTGTFRKPLGQLIFGGVFDRHPRLKIVWSEGGINWIPGALHDAELAFDSYDKIEPEPIKHRPSYYWHNHCYATFQSDTLGLELLKYIGYDRVMWGMDYPHSEGTFGYSRSAIQSIRDAVSEEQARMILGETASKLYGLPKRLIDA